ncbi:hypothetical protein HYQ46_001483 [Verticillium longisporum]|nr:hypothetical protein HYQ46_001483 [Verticillium longisporum]
MSATERRDETEIIAGGGPFAFTANKQATVFLQTLSAVPSIAASLARLGAAPGSDAQSPLAVAKRLSTAPWIHAGLLDDEWCRSTVKATGAEQSRFWSTALHLGCAGVLRLLGVSPVSTWLSGG